MRWPAIDADSERSPVPFGEQGHHLLDLHDLLCGAAKKSQQGFAERLAQNPQAGERRATLGQVGVGAPRQRVGEGVEIIR
jgi:hypothetical protein